MFVLSVGFPNPTNLLCLGFQTTSRHKAGCPTLNFFLTGFGFSAKPCDSIQIR
ncbi:hypothetical protein [Neisseria sicca]|uniref:hypothetical protein n=1 Tax=Neisseria sicca TaxID=490 RepID=UPI00164A0B45|nr:hypothetical protein [Neisseria sicca]